MKQTLSSLFLLIFTFSFSQIQLKIISSKNQKPIYNASVYCDDNLLGKTDANGNLTFKTKCKKVDILANNFVSEEADVKKIMQISLKPSSEKTGNIERIVLSDKSDPKALKTKNQSTTHRFIVTTIFSGKPMPMANYLSKRNVKKWTFLPIISKVKKQILKN